MRSATPIPVDADDILAFELLFPGVGAVEMPGEIIAARRNRFVQTLKNFIKASYFL
jgi:hypothetical protein